MEGRDEYDLVILGWGAAATAAAIRASEITSGQASIAMVGTGPLGGTCVNVGCVPSKYLIEASREAFVLRGPRYPGISSSELGLDFGALMESLREAVRGERRSKYEDVLRSYDNVELVEGRAAFVDEEGISIGQGDRGRSIRGYNFIVATGSRPIVPDIPGIDDVGYLTSDTVWNLDHLPDGLAVIGGSAVGLELGQALSRLGSEVTVIEAMPTILPRAEPEISSALREALEGEGIRMLTGARVLRARAKEKGRKALEVEVEGTATEVEVDEVLVAAGRAPNVDGLNLEAAGVSYSAEGIKVDRHMMTTNPRIYAAGDVVDQPLKLETLAAREGVAAAANIYEHAGMEVDVESFPWAVFTDPQVASVGITEAMASARGIAHSSRVLSSGSVPKARIMRREDGVFKLVADPGSGKVLGVHALSANAAEFIVEGAYIVGRGLTVDDVIGTAHVFPTMSEGVKLAAQSFVRDIARMSCCME